MFSIDGYITRQHDTKHLPYGAVNSDFNGCGWIAAFNFLKSLDYNIDYMEVYSEFKKNVRFRGYFGTSIFVMYNYLKIKIPNLKKVFNLKKFLKSPTDIKSGIILYWEGVYLHYVAFTHEKDNQYRFFNTTSREPNLIITLKDFKTNHVKANLAFLLIV